MRSVPGESVEKFVNVLARVTWLLVCESIVSYQCIRSDFDLNDESMGDLADSWFRSSEWPSMY